MQIVYKTPPLKWRLFSFLGQNLIFRKGESGGRSRDKWTKSRNLETSQTKCGYKKISKLLNLPITSVSSFITRLNSEDICICLECGETFSPLPGKSIKRFCSKKCRLRYWQKKTRTSPKYRVQKVCPECGAVFLTYKYRQGIFCSKECFQTHESRKWREANGKE